jgi:hypothetical protein
MVVRRNIVGAAITLAIVLGLFWGIWLAGRLAFESGGQTPPTEGRGVPTTVTTG